jgi:hypothetical protein
MSDLGSGADDFPNNRSRPLMTGQKVAGAVANGSIPRLYVLHSSGVSPFTLLTELRACSGSAEIANDTQSPCICLT